MKCKGNEMIETGKVPHIRGYKRGIIMGYNRATMLGVKWNDKD